MDEVSTSEFSYLVNAKFRCGRCKAHTTTSSIGITLTNMFTSTSTPRLLGVDWNGDNDWLLLRDIDTFKVLQFGVIVLEQTADLFQRQALGLWVRPIDQGQAQEEHSEVEDPEVPADAVDGDRVDVLILC